MKPSTHSGAMPDSDPQLARLVQQFTTAQRELQAYLADKGEAPANESGQAARTFSVQQGLNQYDAAQRGAAELQTSIIDALPGKLALLDRTGQIIGTNASWRACGGTSATTGPSPFDHANYLEVCDRATGPEAACGHACAQGIREVLAGTRAEFSLEYPCHSPEGKHWFRAVVTPIGRDPIEGAVVIHFDITEHVVREHEFARANRALRLLTESNNAISQSKTEDELLSEACRLAHEIGGYPMAWIGYALDDAERSIQPRARAGGATLDLSSLRLSWSDEVAEGRGPGGKTIRTGETNVVYDLARSHAMKPWWDLSESEGYHGLVCLPLKSPDRTFGIFVVYLDSPGTTPPEELALLNELAEDLSFGILAQRNRQAQNQTQAAMLKIAHSVSSLAGDAFFATLVSSLVEVLEANSGLVARTSAKIPNTLRLLHATDHTRVVSSEDVALPSVAQLAETTNFRWWESPTTVSPTTTRVGLGLRNADSQIIGYLEIGFDAAVDPIQRDFISFTLQIFAARAAAELQRQAVDAHTRRQARLIDEAHDAFIVRDLSGTVHEWSRGAERLFGWTAAEALGRNFNALLKPVSDTLDQAERLLIQNDHWIGEIHKTTKEGSRCVVAARWTLLRDESGRPEGILSINSDITEQQSIQEQLLRAQRIESIGTLAGGIAHDMNNLLAPILLGIGLLKTLIPDENHQRFINNMERSAKRGAALVRQILSFARGVDGARVAVHLKHLIQELESLVENTFPKNITFKIQVAPDLALVSGDPTQLNQVLVNLCVNARDAMPTGGKLSIAVNNVTVEPPVGSPRHGEGRAPHVCITTSDTGTGMPPEIVERIFEPFFTTKPTGEGTGLGLATLLGIVRSHDGFVEVDSTPGKGTTFHIYLPVRIEPEEPSAPIHGSDALPRGHGELILLVDDEPAVLNITRETLEIFGYRVITAANGAQALDLYVSRRDEVDLVLTDMMMPVMDGPGLIAAIRRLKVNAPIIAISGLAHTAPVDQATNLNVQQVLGKPIAADKLLQALHLALHPV